MKKRVHTLHMHFLLAVTCICFAITQSHAQQPTKEKHFISLLANGKKDSILLRWAPASVLAWQMANKYGYTVERFTVARDGVLLKDAEKKPLILAVALKPYSNEAWETIVAKDDRAAIVQDCIYGEQFSTSPAGGGVANMFNKKRELEMRFSFALFTCDVSPAIAKAAGLFLVDKNVKINEQYIYRVRINNLPQDITVEPGVATLVPSNAIKLPAPINVNAVFSDSIVRLSWPSEIHKGIYSAYYIERSIDGKNYVSATGEMPYVQASADDNNNMVYFIDSLKNNTSAYYYRVKGLSPFGETGPASEIVKGHGRAAMTMVPTIEKADNLQNKKVQLQWRFPKEYTNELEGYVILRSLKPDGPFEELNKKVIAPDKFTFIDGSPLLTNYYKVKAIGKQQGLVSLSFPYLVVLEDNLPPAMPVQLAGKSNDSGMVHLHWKPNREKDLQGYRVFRANALTEEFVEITKAIIADTLFADSINIQTLTPNIYYKVIAVDKRFNTSAYSSPLLVKRPDKIPPVAPIITKAKMQGEAIVLEWQTSSSDDVAMYSITRSNIATKQMVTVKEWQASKQLTAYADTALLQGDTYLYYLNVYDSSRNMSFTKSGNIFFESGVRPAIKDIETAVNREKKQIEISWNYKEVAVKKYLIYRAKNNDSFRLQETVTGDVKIFKDRAVDVSNTYRYKIQAVLEGSVSSRMSDVVKVMY